jgi:lipopolysaccharide export system protein LptA
LSAAVIQYNVKTKEMEATRSNDSVVAAVLYPAQLSSK